MANPNHSSILKLVRQNSGKPTQHTHQNNYLGTRNPRYEISVPVMRKIAREWVNARPLLAANEIAELIGSLVGGKSSTEKTMAGIVLDYTTPEQRKFDPNHFDLWLEHLTGWAEVDAVCSGKYTVTELPLKVAVWKKLLNRFAKSKNINKRRASLVLLVSPLRNQKHQQFAEIGFSIINSLKHEKEVLITKAISWLLRSLTKHHAEMVREFLRENAASLPAIAVRETTTKLDTGRKNKKKI